RLHSSLRSTNVAPEPGRRSLSRSGDLVGQPTHLLLEPRRLANRTPSTSLSGPSPSLQATGPFTPTERTTQCRPLLRQEQVRDRIHLAGQRIDTGLCLVEPRSRLLHRTTERVRRLLAADRPTEISFRPTKVPASLTNRLTCRPQILRQPWR